MVNLEEWMELHEMYQQGMSQSEIARRLGLDRKTVRKYLHTQAARVLRSPGTAPLEAGSSPQLSARAVGAGGAQRP